MSIKKIIRHITRKSLQFTKKARTSSITWVHRWTFSHWFRDIALEISAKTFIPSSIAWISFRHWFTAASTQKPAFFNTDLQQKRHNQMMLKTLANNWQTQRKPKFIRIKMPNHICWLSVLTCVFWSSAWCQ